MKESFKVISIRTFDNNGFFNEKFFNGIETDMHGHINITAVSKPYNAMKFLYETNERNVDSLIAFIKTCYTKKEHAIELITVEVSY